MIPSLEASRFLPASLEADSWAAGWRSLLLRQYLDRPTQDEFTTAATADPLFVLVIDGSCQIESLREGRWQCATYGVGNVAMVPPGVASTLRWRSHEPHRTLQLHLPRHLLQRQCQELWDRDLAAVQLPRLLACQDAVIQTTLVSLAQGMSAGLPDLYAETAAEFLSAHLLLHHCGTIAGPEHDDRRLRRVDDYLRDHLDKEVSLEDLATHASLSRFHLLRLYKRKYGETPLKRLTRFRMAEAKRHLQHGQLSIAQIATRCGYDNPAHFASAFRRVEGVPPTAFRKR